LYISFEVEGMDEDLPSPAAILPVKFECWRQTCEDLAQAIAAGPGTVALVGPAGSGKTFTLANLAIAFEMAGQHVSLKVPDTNAAPALNPEPTMSDMVPVEAPPRSADPDRELYAAIDGAAGPLINHDDQMAAQRIAATPLEKGTKVIAVRPDAVGALLRRVPDARLVTMRPLSASDARLFLAARCQQAGLPANALAEEIITSLTAMAAGNPGLLGRLFDATRQVAADQPTFNGWTDANDAAATDVASNPAGEGEIEAGMALDAHPAWHDPMRLPGSVAPEASDLEDEERAGQETAGLANHEPLADLATAEDAAPEQAPRPSWDVLTAPPQPHEIARARKAQHRRVVRRAALAAAICTLAGLTIAARLNPDFSQRAAAMSDEVRQSVANTWANLHRGLRLSDLRRAPAALPGGLNEPTADKSHADAAQTIGTASAGGAAKPLAKAYEVVIAPPDSDAGSARSLANQPPPAADHPVVLPSSGSLQPFGDEPASNQNVLLSPSPERHAAIATPGPLPMAAAPAPLPMSDQENAEEALRLLKIGKALLSIGQFADARSMLEAAAGMGNTDAAAMVATVPREAPAAAVLGTAAHGATARAPAGTNDK
jgi:hypothetical protein